LSRYYGLPYLDVTAYQPEQEALALLPHDLARRFRLLPLFRLDDRLYAAVSDARDLGPQEYVRQMTGFMVEPVLAAPRELDEAITRNYLSAEQSRRAIETITGMDEETAGVEDVASFLENRDAPIVKLLDKILADAVHLRASDIHLEPFPRRVQLRYRVDGILHEFPPPPPALYPALVSRIKIASHLDIAERRLPQDGRTSFTLDGVRYDMRVSIIPNVHGEGVVIRVLNTEESQKNLTDLGFSEQMLQRFERLIRRPYGMLLVSGPTGSGKTTTLYATLRSIYTPARKMITLEDPVEYQLDGITQIAVKPEIGFTFAEGLRAILRHDPDIVMVGEIRDLETAEIAVRASLTGHLFFSTIHTNNAPLAIARMVDMGVEPFKVMASLNGVLAQRLVRRLCPDCKVEIPYGEEQLRLLNIPRVPEGARLFKAVGCASCGGRGYRGRVAIYELVEITPTMRRTKPQNLTPEKITEIAFRETGFTTLRRSALEKLFTGVTSLEEVLSITSTDE
ncbi:MAG TPA: GspE/PulE family protein, partial [Candidatus Nitrosotenuis sp.]|nr:GspE/PulE family protein [Candidatus Nitrosotenuis sp.]